IRYVTKHDQTPQTRRFFKLIRHLKLNRPKSRGRPKREQLGRLWFRYGGALPMIGACAAHAFSERCTGASTARSVQLTPNQAGMSRRGLYFPRRPPSFAE